MSELDVTKCYPCTKLGMGGGKDSLLPFVKKPELPPEPPSVTKTCKDQQDSSVSVYVRVRPLLEAEIESGVGMMPGMVTVSSAPDEAFC